MCKWRRSFFSLVFSIFSIPAFAKEATVFDVRRPLAMDNSETPPKDYYISAGERDGLKRGMLVTVNRRQSLYDQYHNKSPGDIVVAVGQLRLIHTQTDISVARLENIQNRDNLPTLDFDAIMTGDKVDLASAKMAPQKTASLEVPIPAPLPVSTEVLPEPASPLPSPGPSLLKTGSQDSSSVAPL